MTCPDIPDGVALCPQGNHLQISWSVVSSWKPGSASVRVLGPEGGGVFLISPWNDPLKFDIVYFDSLQNLLEIYTNPTLLL
jgi:hypothetical protein